jgi:hypothetical protein
MDTPMGTAMEGYFDNLAEAAMNDNQVLEEMVNRQSHRKFHRE